MGYKGPARLSRAGIAVRLLLAGATLAPAFAWAQPQPAAAASTSAPRKAYAIPSGPLEDVLNRFARESGALISVNAALVKGLQSPGLRGSFSLEDGFEQLLRAHALRVQRNSQGIFVVQSAPPPPPPTRAAAPSSSVAATTGASAAPPVSEAVLPAVVVTAERDRKEAAYETPAAVSVITREDIDRTGPRHASEILQATPGVFTVTNEQVPSVSVDVRGLKDFGRVTMSIDGMRQNYQRSGHQQRNGEMFFDTEFLSGVEIDKGPGAGVGGLGATGGVANFQTLEAEDVLLAGKTIGLRLRGTTGVGGWANGSKPSGSAAFAIKASDDLDLVFAASARRSDAYEPGRHGLAFSFGSSGDLDNIPINTIGLTHQNQDSLLFKARWKPLPGHQLKFTALQTRLDYAESSMQDLDAAYQRYVIGCGEPAPQPGDPGYAAYVACLNAYDPDSLYPKTSSSDTKSTSLGLDYSWKPTGNPWIDLAAKVYYVTTDNRSIATRDTASTFVTRTDTLGVWAANTSLVTLSPDWLLEWRQGAEVFQDRNRPSTESTQYSDSELAAINGNTPNGQRLLAGAFTQVGLHYRDWLQVTPGIRFEYARLWGRTGFVARDLANNGQLLRQYANIDVDRRFDRWLPSLNVAVKPVHAVQLFANAAKGWRPPAITEALITGNTPGHSLPVSYYPNYLLVPEETTSMEVGANLRWDNLLARGDKLRMKATAFRSKTDGYVFFTNNIGLPGGSWGMLNNMFVASTDPVVFKGWELEANYDAGGWFAGLGVTRLERKATFMHLASPLYTGPLVQTPTNNSTNGYTPAPPKYSARVNLGVRLMERKLELGTTVRCASKGYHASLDGGSLQGIQDTQNSFCVWDAQVAYRPSERYAIGLTLRNVGDRQYAQAMGDSLVRTYAPGRTLTAFVEARF